MPNLEFGSIILLLFFINFIFFKLLHLESERKKFLSHLLTYE